MSSGLGGGWRFATSRRRSWLIYRISGHRTVGISLFTAVAGAVVAGGGLAVLWFALVRAVVGSSAASIDVLKVAFTAVAGVGGAVALVVAYRRQNDLEQGRFVERFGAGAAQLGNPDPAVRIAGVYAIAGAADESTTYSRRQQCIDVLCGYLRLPYDRQYGDSYHTELITATKRLPSESATQSIEQQHTERRTIRQNDREVRQTVVRVIAAHLREHADMSWSNHDFDFSTVMFEDADFDETTFCGQSTSFDKATFSGQRTSFDEAKFSGESTSFRNVAFSSGDSTSFYGTAFIGGLASFNGATFCGRETTFSGAVFSGERTSFAQATFGAKNTSFSAAAFGAENTSFTGATFDGGVNSFDAAAFSGQRTSFDDATFAGERISFAGATFGGANASFEEPRLWQNVTFDWDDSPDEMPSCIKPRTWPPTLAA
jgi:hypothetical protein